MVTCRESRGLRENSAFVVSFILRHSGRPAETNNQNVLLYDLLATKYNLTIIPFWEVHGQLLHQLLRASLRALTKSYFHYILEHVKSCFSGGKS